MQTDGAIRVDAPASGSLRPTGEHVDGARAVDDAVDELDPRAYDLPTVGVWVAGARNVLHLGVWAACLRFARSAALRDKATQRGSFLLATYVPGRSSRGPSFHDVALADEAVYKDAERLMDTQFQIAETERELEEANGEWESFA